MLPSHQNPRLEDDQLEALEQALEYSQRVQLQLTLLDRSFQHLRAYRSSTEGAAPRPWPRSLPGAGPQLLLSRQDRDGRAVCLLLDGQGAVREATFPASLPPEVDPDVLAAATTVSAPWTPERPLPSYSHAQLEGVLREVRAPLQRRQAVIEALRGDASSGARPEAGVLADQLEQTWFPPLRSRRAAGRAVPALPTEEEWEAIVYAAGGPFVAALRELGKVALDRVTLEGRGEATRLREHHTHALLNSSVFRALEQVRAVTPEEGPTETPRPQAPMAPRQ